MKILKSYKKSLSRLVILLCLQSAIQLFPESCSAQVTCTSTGTWSATAGWAPAAPVAGDNVIVAVGCTLYVDMLTPLINNLTINGVVIVENTGSGVLSVDGNLIVNSGAALINNGSIVIPNSGSAFQLNGTGTYIHNPLNNLVSDEDVFTNMNEAFANTSNLIIQKWNDGNVPLAGPTRVQTSIFGNVVLEANVAGGTWDQDGFFSVPSLNRIRGSLTVSASTVVMDDGTGSTTSLILQDVTVNGTGNIVFQRGYNRNYSLTMQNFLVSSIAPAKPTVVMDTSFGVLNMTVNGNMNLEYDFNVVYGHNFPPGADIRVTVNGNLNITGGNVIFNHKATAPLRVTVSGNTTLNNLSPGGIVCFVDGGGTGAFLFSTTNLIISGGNLNYLYGYPGVVPAVKGTATLNISNDFIVDGTSNTYIAYSDTSIAKVRVAVARDFTINASNALLVGAYTNGAFTIKTDRNLSLFNGNFIGQAYPPNLAIDSIITGGEFLFNSFNPSDYFIGNRSKGNTFFITTGNFSILSSGTGYRQGVIGVDSSSSNISFSVAQNFIQNAGQFAGILSGSGNINFNVTGVLNMNGGICKIHHNTIYANTGNITFFAGSIDFDGGIFSGYFGSNNSGLTGNFLVGTTVDINYTAVTDEFSFIGVSIVGTDVNNLMLFLSIPGGLSIGGLNGTFFSSIALGTEIINIGGINISNGTNSFNGQPGLSASIGHIVIMTISGNIIVSGGDNYLSAMSQNITANITGDVVISNGSLSLKGNSTTNSTMNIQGGFSLTNGNFYIHNHLTLKMPEGSIITVTVNSNDDNIGNYTHTGGTFYFDNCSTTPASMNLILSVKSPVYTLGGNGLMTMTLPGTGSVHGILNFSRNGTIAFNRSGTHNIEQVKQSILTNCTLDVVSGNMQLASHNSAGTPPDALWVYSGAVLDLRTNQLFSNANRPNCGVSVFGRLRTQNVHGLYDGTLNAALSTNITDNFDYYLASSSTIEYYGVDTQVLTGLGIGKALNVQHKYGHLEINFGGTPDLEFVYPTNIPNDSSVMVRGNLLLTQGELNLDNDHDMSNLGGRWIVLENNAVTAMQRTAGYIRSESQDGNGLVKWIMNSVTGSRTIHFGFNSVSYIPFVFSHASGNSAILYSATYHTDSLNLPYPPPVTHVRNSAGLDNSMNTVDRFWFIQTRGTIPSANLTFNCTPAERGTINSLVAQKWVESNQGWTLPPPGLQTGLTYGVQANNITDLHFWWTLSGNAIPLPVDLISFRGICRENNNQLIWTTASEINNDYFLIEKSFDGSTFEEIAKVPGAGNSTQQNSYSFTDHTSPLKTTYYRLTQTDFDGQTSKSNIISVNSCKDQNRMSVLIASNYESNVSLFIQAPIEDYLTLEIINLDGRIMKQTSIAINSGLNIIPVNEPGLSSGLYILKVYNNFSLHSFRFFKGK